MKKRRWIALLLCFCMTAGTFTPVLAADEEDAVIVAEDSDQISYVEVYTAEDLNDIRNRSDKNYILMNDIDLSEYENWEPISSDAIQIFNGNGHTISNMRIYAENADTQYYGLFGNISHSNSFSISDLTITNSTIYTSSSADVTVGAVCALAKKSVQFINCDSDTDITVISNGNILCGGLAGASSSMENCRNFGDISIESYMSDESEAPVLHIGGCSGKSGYIVNSANYGNITTTGGNEQYISGIAGTCSGSIIDTANYGEITVSEAGINSTLYIGGICGKNSTSGEITACRNAGNTALVNISSEVCFGGIIGFTYVDISGCSNSADFSASESDSSFVVGGICGAVNLGSITTSASTGNISINTENGARVGGIVGTGGSLSYCYNTGNIEIYAPARAYVGGLYGSNTGYPTLVDCYNTGNISAESNEALVGSCVGGKYKANITSCYNIGNMEAVGIDENKSRVGIFRSGATGSSSNHPIIDSYYLSSASYMADELYVDGTALSDTEMCDKANFEGFDFDTVWEIGVTEGYSYPTLRENPHIVNDEDIIIPDINTDYPAPVLAIDSQDGEYVVFIWNYCEGAVEYEFVITYSSGEESCYTIPATDNPNTSYTFGTTYVNDWTYRVYALYEDGTRVVSNIVDFNNTVSSITTTFDTTEITLEEGAIFNFNGLVSTTAETGLNDLQINIANAETGVGIKYHREDDIGTSEFDLSAVPSFAAGTTLTGEDQQGYKHTLELTAGTSWYVHLFATDNAGNNIGEDVVKKITITENPGEFLIGNKYIQTSYSDYMQPDESENTPYILFTDNNKGEFYVMTDEPAFCASYYFTYTVTVEDDTITLISDDEYGFDGSAHKIVLEIIDNTTLKIVSFEPEAIDGLSYSVGWSAIGDTFKTEMSHANVTVECLDTEDYAGNYRDFTVTFDSLPANAYLQFDNQYAPDEWLSDEYCSTNPAFIIDNSKLTETENGYVYKTTFIIHSEGLANNSYLRKVRVAYPTADGITYSEPFEFNVYPIPDVPQNKIGYAYAQTLDISDDTELPAITAVIAAKKNGYYRLSVGTYICDNNAVPFFYWEADSGEFQKVDADFKVVDFIPDDSNTVTVYMGDGLGYVASYTLNINQ